VTRTEKRTDGIAISISSVALISECRILLQKYYASANLVTGGAYAPYAPCLSTPLMTNIYLMIPQLRSTSFRSKTFQVYYSQFSYCILDPVLRSESNLKLCLPRSIFTPSALQPQSMEHSPTTYAKPAIPKPLNAE